MPIRGLGPQSRTDTLLVNANVLTMDTGRPRAEAIAVTGERIVAVGGQDELRNLAAPTTKIVDCQGMTLLPGFIDAHCHLLALARTFQDLDCRPGLARSIPELQWLLRSRARTLPAGRWVRGYGYDDRQLAEQRHPTRWDLDEAVPDHPVRLDHRSGHAAVLNSLGLQLAEIHQETPDPVAGIIERVPGTGEPTGVLLEMSKFLRERLGNVRKWPDLEAGVAGASRQLLSYGVTSIQDAGADNGLEKWTTFRRLQESDALAPRVTMFAGAERLGEFLEAGMRWGSGDHRLRLGHVKVMLTLTTGALTPAFEDLGRLTRLAHQAGFPVAVHCIEQEAVKAAAEVLGERRAASRNSGDVTPRDRIEHCAECPPELVDMVRRSGAMVVTQPGFIYWNGPSYRERVARDLQPHLYPVGALHRAGVSVAFGSDAPVIDPNPWPSIYSAVSWLAHDGHPVAANSIGQAVNMETALRAHTLAGAVAEGTASDKGSITPGKLADLVLVDRDPLATGQDCVEGIRDTRPVMTILGGKIAWQQEGSNVMNHPEV